MPAKKYAHINVDPMTASPLTMAQLSRREHRVKRAESKAAIGAVDEMIATRQRVAVALQADQARWCRRCRAERKEDPCEACDFRTEEKSD